MRTAFIRTLTELAEADDRIFLLVGDVGFGVVEGFASRFPKRYLNVGVAEANLAGVSAGLALSGRIPFMYSIGNFPTLRCFEQIRNDICYNGANVKIVSVGAGLAYGPLGATHHATEDLAVMRSLPNMTVLAPADPCETVLATRAAAAASGPVYMRIGRSGDAALHTEAPAFEIGRAIEVRQGHDAAVIATGSMTLIAAAAADLLSAEGTSVRVLSMHSLKPLDHEAITRAVVDTRAVLTLEEHSIVGGLGAAVAEVVAESRVSPFAFQRMGLPDRFAHDIGSREYLLVQRGLTAADVVTALRDLIRRKKE